MKKKRVIFILFVLLIAVITFYYRSSSSEKWTKSTNLSDEEIGGTVLHENINSSSFVKQYGSPLSKDNNSFYDYYHWKNGLLTASLPSGKEKGSIMRLIIKDTDDNSDNSPLHTAKDIVLGDKKEKVISLYGNNYYKSNEQGADIIGYIDHKHKITLEFWCVRGGGVAEIRLDDASVE